MGSFYLLGGFLIRVRWGNGGIADPLVRGMPHWGEGNARFGGRFPPMIMQVLIKTSN